MKFLSHSYTGPYLASSTFVRRTPKQGVLRLATLNGVRLDFDATRTGVDASERKFIGSAVSGYPLIDEEPLFIGSALDAFPPRESEPFYRGSAYSASAFAEPSCYGPMSLGRSVGLLTGDDLFYFPPSEPASYIPSDARALSPDSITAQDRVASENADKKRLSLRSKFGAILAGWLKSDSEPHPHRRRRPF